MKKSILKLSLTMTALFVLLILITTSERYFQERSLDEIIEELDRILALDETESAFNNFTFFNRNGDQYNLLSNSKLPLEGSGSDTVVSYLTSGENNAYYDQDVSDTMYPRYTHIYDLSTAELLGRFMKNLLALGSSHMEVRADIQNNLEANICMDDHQTKVVGISYIFENIEERKLSVTYELNGINFSDGSGILSNNEYYFEYSVVYNFDTAETERSIDLLEQTRGHYYRLQFKEALMDYLDTLIPGIDSCLRELSEREGDRYFPDFAREFIALVNR